MTIFPIKPTIFGFRLLAHYTIFHANSTNKLNMWDSHTYLIKDGHVAFDPFLGHYLLAGGDLLGFDADCLPSTLSIFGHELLVTSKESFSFFFFTNYFWKNP